MSAYLNINEFLGQLNVKYIAHQIDLTLHISHFDEIDPLNTQFVPKEPITKQKYSLVYGSLSPFLIKQALQILRPLNVHSLNLLHLVYISLS